MRSKCEGIVTTPCLATSNDGIAYTEPRSKWQLPEGSKSLGAEPFSRMVEILLRRTIGYFELLAILLLLVTAGCRSIEGSRRGEVLAKNMKIESLADATRYQWIERTMRNHLQNDPERDNSFIHVLVHPKVNPRVAEAVLKAFPEAKSAVIWRDEDTSVVHECAFNETCSKISQVVGIYEEVEDVNPHEWKNSYGLAWNSRSKIAIWLGRSVNSTDALDKIKFEELLTRFWSINALNVVLLATPWCESEKNCSSKPGVFGYDPFVPQPGRKRGKLIERSFDEPLFPDKLRNLHGTPIRMSMYHHEPFAILINYTELGGGLEANNIRYLMSWINFTIELVTAPTTFDSYSIQLPDGQKVGPIGDILKNRSTFLANSDYLENTWGHRVEFVQPFARAYETMLVPPAGRIPEILRLFRSIDLAVIGLIIASSFLLILYFVARKKRNPFFRIVRLLLHQHIDNIGESSSERIFLIFWIFWAFIICTASQTQLIKDLTAPPYYKSIDTLAELADSSLTLLIEQEDITSLRNDESKIKNRLAEKAVFEQNFNRCTRILVTHGNVSCSIDSQYVGQVEKRLNAIARQKAALDPSRRKKGVHAVKEVLADYWRTVVVQEGFPYLNKFNGAYSKIIEMGLAAKWWLDSSKPEFDTNWRLTTHQKLTMQHLGGSFKILMLGLSAAFVVLLAEIVVHRVKRRLRVSSWCPSSLSINPSARNRSGTSKSQSVRTVDSVSLERIERR